MLKGSRESFFNFHFSRLILYEMFLQEQVVQLATIQFQIKKNRFNDVYYPYLTKYDTRYNVFYGGSGSGKSKFVVQKLIYKYLQYQGRKCLVVRKVEKDIRESVFEEFKTLLHEWKLFDKCTIKESYLDIILPNGSQFIFKGLEDIERIKSISGIDDILIEEATELNQEDFEQLDLRLRSKKPYNQIHLAYNPVSKANWVYNYWHCRTLDPSIEFLLHTTYKDNKFLPEANIKAIEAKKETNPTYYKIYALGEFATLDKLIFNNWRIEDFNYKDILKDKANSIAVFGLDFGYTNDPSAFIGVVIDNHNKKIYVFEEFQQKGLLNNEIAKKIIDLGFGKEIIYADSSEPKSIEELRKHGLHRVKGVKKGKDSILNGIQFLQQFEIMVHPKCAFISEELSNYTWQKDRNGFYINKPVDKYNHSLDALRYAVQTINVGVGCKVINLKLRRR